MIRVAINGYGTIGKRVADAVTRQPDMTVAGIAKRTPNCEAKIACERRYCLYAASEDDRAAFDQANLEANGTIDDLLIKSDVIVDTTPDGVAQQYRDRYKDVGIPVVYQGGEDADIADASFTTCVNGDITSDADIDSLRVVSCNTTGMAHALTPLDEQFGVSKLHATLVRRGGDPAQIDRGPLDCIIPDPVTIPSHHAADLAALFPDIDVTTVGLKVPTTVMHVRLTIMLNQTPTKHAIQEALNGQSRINLVENGDGLTSTASLKEQALDMGRLRGDRWENCLWTGSIYLDDLTLSFVQAIHQEGNVVPENIDAIRALVSDTAPDGGTTTEEVLGITEAVEPETPQG